MKKKIDFEQKEYDLAMHILNNVVTRPYIWSAVECFGLVFERNEIDDLIDFCLKKIGY